MTNLKNKLIITTAIISATLGFGCDLIQDPIYNRSILKNYCDKKTEKVVYGMTYWDFAKKLKKENPKLKDMDTRDVTKYLKDDLNESKELIAGKEIILPMYNCKK